MGATSVRDIMSETIVTVSADDSLSVEQLDENVPLASPETDHGRGGSAPYFEIDHHPLLRVAVLECDGDRVNIEPRCHRSGEIERDFDAAGVFVSNTGHISCAAAEPDSG